MNSKTTIWIFLALIALLCAGCSPDNNTSGNNQPEATKPPPQVRVEFLPSPTVVVIPTEVAAAATPEPTTVVPGQVYIEPTPDEDAIMAQIDSLIQQIDQKLNSQDLLLKP